MIEKNELLKLDDDKEYQVVDSRILDNINYIYLVDRENQNNFMFCEFDNNNKLIKVTDETIIEKLALEFVLDVLKEDK